MAMTEEELIEIEARASEATAGPWVWLSAEKIGGGGEGQEQFGVWKAKSLISTAPGELGESATHDEFGFPERGDPADDPILCCTDGSVSAMACNLNLIAHAREDIPALIAEIRRLRKFHRAKAGGE